MRALMIVGVLVLAACSTGGKATPKRRPTPDVSTVAICTHYRAIQTELAASGSVPDLGTQIGDITSEAETAKDPGVKAAAAAFGHELDPSPPPHAGQNLAVACASALSP